MSFPLLTIGWPRQLAAECRLFCVDPEPHSGGGIPSVDVLACGNLGQVGLEWTRVVDVGVNADADWASSSNTNGLVSGLHDHSRLAIFSRKYSDMT